MNVIEFPTKKYDAQAGDALAPGPKPHLGRVHFFHEMRATRTRPRADDRREPGCGDS